MAEADALAHEFMGEVNDKYYPQVMEGLDLMESGELGRGAETIARPLHTIKGVTGFMSGFEEASRFTHSVESFMKKLQSGDLAADESTVGLAMEAVNAVFAVLEALHQGQSMESTEAGEIVERLEAAKGEAGGPAAAVEGGVRLEWAGGRAVLRVAHPRLHLESQRQELLDALRSLPQGSQALLDLRAVSSMSSTTLEELETLAQGLDIRLCGLSPACKEVFYGWRFDRRLGLQDQPPEAEGRAEA
jgi:chemotaxis protein histidine kinase CheA